MEILDDEYKSVTTFLKRDIFSKFGIPQKVISDKGLDFCLHFGNK